MKSIALLRSFDIDPGIVMTITQQMLDHAEEIYTFLSQEKLKFMFNPPTFSGSARDNFSDIEFTQEKYAEFWKKLYDLWFDEKIPYVTCREFVDKTQALLMGRPKGCMALAQCADSNISVEPLGEVYICSTLSGNKELSYGNIVDDTLTNLMKSDKAKHFRLRPEDPMCTQCEWKHVCHGGCMSRAYKFFGTINRRDHYCRSLKMTWAHIKKRLTEKGLATAKLHPDRGDRIFSLKDTRAEPLKFIPIIPA